MKAQAEEQARQRQAEVAQLKRDQERFKCEMKEMKEHMCKENDVNAAKEEELRAREREFERLKQQANELTDQGKLDAKQLKEERKRAKRAKGRRRKRRRQRRMQRLEL